MFNHFITHPLNSMRLLKMHFSIPTQHQAHILHSRTGIIHSVHLGVSNNSTKSTRVGTAIFGVAASPVPQAM